MHNEPLMGKIVKGIAGFYYVNTTNKGTFACNAKGAFRNVGIKPLVGDDVLFSIIDEKEKTGNVIKILERKNSLIRPNVANVDQALVIFGMRSPDPNFNLLDRFLIYMETENVPTIIVFNKDDLGTKEEADKIKDAYKNSGFSLYFVCARKQEGIEELRKALAGKTTVVAGPSGVGKSSIINLLYREDYMETGSISVKTERGKNTTRHSELLCIGEDSYIMDTPGFTALEIPDLTKEYLKDYFEEFAKYRDDCRFRTCVHINEPDCAIKSAVFEGKISKMRYDSYVELYNQLPKEGYKK